ncbi:MAG: TSUP family transporter [Terrimicrobiaceae bacterium]|jgi:hypothetical protein|nr:hypothetical protein [Terrimicrobiaceae bacterium]
MLDSPWQWIGAYGAAACIGLSKTGFGGIGMAAVLLMACRLPKYEFVGAAAWFFFIVNVIKVPFSASLGLINPSSLWLNLLLVPGIAAGVVTGRFLFSERSPSRFLSGW